SRRSSPTRHARPLDEALQLPVRTVVVDAPSPTARYTLSLHDALPICEGTLAVLGDLTLRLVPKPEQVVTFSIQFSTLSDAARAVSMLIAKGSVPRCAELLDETTLKVMRAAGAPCSERANAMLILEVDGHEEIGRASCR